jgi:hypothetical protein
MSATAASAIQRILDPVGRCLTVDVARALVDLRTDAETQARLEELADKSTEGALTPAERDEYAGCVAAVDFVSVLQATARAVVATAEEHGLVSELAPKLAEGPGGALRWSEVEREWD